MSDAKLSNKNSSKSNITKSDDIKSDLLNITEKDIRSTVDPALQYLNEGLAESYKKMYQQKLAELKSHLKGRIRDLKIPEDLALKGKEDEIQKFLMRYADPGTIKDKRIIESNELMHEARHRYKLKVRYEQLITIARTELLALKKVMAELNIKLTDEDVV